MRTQVVGAVRRRVYLCLFSLFKLQWNISLLYHTNMRHCRFIALLLFGVVVDTMDKVDWDWVTPQPNSLLRKSTICLQSFQFLLDITSVCLLMQMEVFGAVDTINVDNWDWGT